MPGPALPIGIGAGLGALGGALGGTETEQLPAPFPQFGDPFSQALLGIFGPGQSGQNFQQRFGQQFGLNVPRVTQGNQQLAGLGGLLSNQFRQFTGGNNLASQTAQQTIPGILGLNLQGAVGQANEAFGPLFQQQQQQQAARLTENFQGGRFSTQLQNELGNQQRLAGNEFNAFLNQAGQGILQQQLAQFLGAQGAANQVSGLNLQGLGQFGNFLQGQQGLNLQGALGQNAQQGQFLQQLFGMLGQGAQSPGFVQRPNAVSNIFGGAAQGAGVGLGFLNALNPPGSPTFNITNSQPSTLTQQSGPAGASG
jgi:hypothetical protein